MIRACGLATFVTHSSQGLLATPLPLFYAESEGDFGTLHGHIAKANPQWLDVSAEDALVIFQGVNSYITPSWYPAKAEHGRVVPTWNYLAVHAYGPVEFYEDPKRLLAGIAHLTHQYEAGRPQPWAVTDSPPEYIQAQLHGIVGLSIPIRRIEAKRKLSQNQSAKNRAGAKAGLADSPFPEDREVSELVQV
jgi:transcriptional regulator